MKELHTEIINTRWTKAERAEIEKLAKRNGLKPAVFIRWLYRRWRTADELKSFQQKAGGK